MPMHASRRRAERAAEAARQAKEAQTEIDSLRAEVRNLRTILRAAWELVRDELGKDDDALLQRVRDLEETDKPGARVAARCPSCDRALQNHASQCIYCGETIERKNVF